MQSNLVIDDADDKRSQSPSDTSARTRIRVWDLPVRIFHWTLALAVIVAFVTAKLGGSWMEVHGKAGLTILGLVVFRLAWGFGGSTHARFVSFAPSPAKLLAYWKGQWRGVGHNPFGALSVFALLGLLALQTGTGLFANDDIAFSGPFHATVDDALSGRLTALHHQLSNVLLGLVGLHLAAIVFHVRVRKDKLVKPMLSGWKDAPSAEHVDKGRPAALVVALIIALAAVFVASGAVLPKSPPPAPPAASSPW